MAASPLLMSWWVMLIVITVLPVTCVLAAHITGWSTSVTPLIIGLTVTVLLSLLCFMSIGLSIEPL